MKKSGGPNSLYSQTKGPILPSQTRNPRKKYLKKNTIPKENHSGESPISTKNNLVQKKKSYHHWKKMVPGWWNLQPSPMKRQENVENSIHLHEVLMVPAVNLQGCMLKIPWKKRNATVHGQTPGQKKRRQLIGNMLAPVSKSSVQPAWFSI